MSNEVKMFVPIPTAVEFLKGLPFSVDMTFEKRKALGELCSSLFEVMEKGSDTPIESIGKIKVADAIELLTDLKADVSEDVAQMLDEVIALLQALGAYGYPRRYGYPKPYGYPYAYPYPVPVAASEGKEAQKLTDELKAAISELVVAKVEELLASKAPNNDQAVSKEELTKAILEEVGKKLSELEAAITAGVAKSLEELNTRLSVLEKALAISQRILPDTDAQKKAVVADFWKGVLPF